MHYGIYGMLEHTECSVVPVHQVLNAVQDLIYPSAAVSDGAFRKATLPVHLSRLGLRVPVGVRLRIEDLELNYGIVGLVRGPKSHKAQAPKTPSKPKPKALNPSTLS